MTSQWNELYLLLPLFERALPIETINHSSMVDAQFEGGWGRAGGTVAAYMCTFVSLKSHMIISASPCLQQRKRILDNYVKSKIVNFCISGFAMPYLL